MKALKTKTVDFTLEIKYNIPKNATPIYGKSSGLLIGFSLNEKTYKPQVVLEEASMDEEEFKDLDTSECIALGILTNECLEVSGYMEGEL